MTKTDRLPDHITVSSRRVTDEIWTVRDLASSASVPSRILTVTVDKRGARIRFEDETEDSVTIVVEPK